ncbi:glycosyltransferase [Glutamicibacter sp. 363]|uniref:glycosyltransferase n=1 Tax=Glutamicibacter sp. 363 TaxID=3457731 RepID=UPI004033B294
MKEKSEVTSRNRILLYGDMNLNLLDGSAVWLVSMAQCLAATNSDVTLLLKAPVIDDRLIRALRGLPNLTIVDVFKSSSSSDNQQALTPRLAGRELVRLHQRNKYDFVISRGSAICKMLARGGHFVGKLWPYITDLPESASEYSPQLKDDLRDILDSSVRMFVQTELSRQLMNEILPGANSKLVLLNPMIPDEFFEEKHDKVVDPSNLSAVYVGKFHEDWRTLEMASLPETCRNINCNLEVTFVGDKVQRSKSDPKWADNMQQVLSSPPAGVQWLGGMSRIEAIQEMRKHDFGLGWRTAALDKSPEISTKLLEYCAVGLPSIVNRTLAHEKLLGKNYPLFVDLSIEDTISKISTDPERLVRAREAGRRAAKYYSISASAKRLEIAMKDAHTRVAPILAITEVNKAEDSIFIGTNPLERELKLAGFISKPDELYSYVKIMEKELHALNLESSHLRSETEILRKALTSTRVNLKNSIDVLDASVKQSIVVQPRTDNGNSRKPASISSAKSVPSKSTPKIVASSKPSLPELQANLSNSRTPENLEVLIDHLWNISGEIKSSNQIVAENQDLVLKMSNRGQRIARQIQSTSRIRENGIKLAPKLSGATYLEKTDSVMYCVHAAPPYNSNGYAKRTKGIADGLKSSGISVTVVGRPGYPWDSSIDIEKPTRKRQVTRVDCVDYVVLPEGHLHNDPLDQYLLTAADSLIQEARRATPSVIQSASNYLTALPAIIAARRLGVPFIYEVRGLWEVSHASVNPGWESSERYAHQVELETFIASNADRVLAITKQVASELVRRGVPENLIEVVPNAVDTEEFAPLLRNITYGESLNISSRVPVIGFAGSVVEYEGLDLLIEAASILKSRGVGFEVFIAGDGRDLPRLRDLATEMDLLDVVTLAGRLPSKDIPSLISTFSIVACPRHSLAVTELVSPLKPLEAMGAGRAVVLSDVAPHRDIAGPGQIRAALFKSDDALDFADVLENLINDSEKRESLARAGRLWAVDERNWAKIGRTIRNAYEVARLSRASQVEKSPFLDELTIGLVADSYYELLLSSNLNVFALSRDRWLAELESERLDAVVIQSAWNGNGGNWTGAVSGTDAEASEALNELINKAESLNIPTILWNTQDGYYPATFLKHAARVKSVATSDSNLLPAYLTASNQDLSVVSISGMVDERLHDSSKNFVHKNPTLDYAGLRFSAPVKQVSAVLEKAKRAVDMHTIQIHGRGPRFNTNNPLSEDLADGAVQWKHDNVATCIEGTNLLLSVSTGQSPTFMPEEVLIGSMLGKPQLHLAANEAISRFFGDSIVVSNDPDVIAGAWKKCKDEIEFFAPSIREARRRVYSAHRAKHVLALMLRTAGVNCAVRPELSFISVCTSWTMDDCIKLLKQSVRPQAVLGEITDDKAMTLLKNSGVGYLGGELAGNKNVTPNDWIVEFPSEEIEENYFSDLLSYASNEGVDQIVYGPEDTHEPKRVESKYLGGAMVRSEHYASASEKLLRTVVLSPKTTDDVKQYSTVARTHTGTVLFAGHDFKFVGGVERELEAAGYKVTKDAWAGHNAHDEEKSRRLLSMANIVFCEWGLGNAVWYSHNLRSDQKLFVRVHSQELFVAFLSRVKQEAVSKYIFVSAHIRAQAIRDHGLDPEKCVVVPNTVPMVDDTPPLEASKFTLGLVGIIPKLKRIDRALDIVEILHERDSRFNLRIRSKLPVDYPWMKRRPEELKWYEKSLERASSQMSSYVTFDPFGPDMADWYRQTGFALSVSDFEAMHSTLPDAAALGTTPVGLLYPGADRVFPREWLHASTGEMADFIWELSQNSPRRIEFAKNAQIFTSTNYRESVIGARIMNIITEL